MSARGDATDFGDARDWGLTPQTFAQVRDELADHVLCLQADEGAPASTAAREQLAVPAARRRITAVHISDQVYATLHRKPTRQEGRELGWLLLWFALILLSDWVAVRALTSSAEFTYHVSNPDPRTSQIAVLLTWSAWLLQGISRAGFFATFAYSLWHAWRVGWGVALGRLLQLKLIHTVLVVTAGLTIGGVLDRYSWGGFYPYDYQGLGPGWLTAPVISIVLLATGALVWLIRRQSWGWGLAMILMAGFFYPGGPTQGQKYQLTRTYMPHRILLLSDGRKVADWEYDNHRSKYRGADFVRELPKTPAELKAWYAEHDGKHKSARTSSVDFERNSITFTNDYPIEMKGHVREWVSPTERYDHYDKHWWRKEGDLVKIGTPFQLGPLAAPGAGIGWLAAPIPFLGAIGLFSLLALMGRRGPVDFVMYLLLVGLAMLTTVMPFMVGQPANSLFEFSSMGVVHSPFPGFEGLMITPWEELASNYMAVTLVGGLLLSAGIPWLLTALFLKPGSAPKRGPEREVAA